MGQDYSHIGLDSRLRSLSSLANRHNAGTATDLPLPKMPQPDNMKSNTSPFIPGGLHQTQQSQFKPNVGYGQILLTKDYPFNNPVQTAINKVFKTGGGNLLIAPGTYFITDTLTIPSGVSLIGIDSLNCAFDFLSGTQNIQVDFDANNVNFENLTFQHCANGSAVIYYDTPTFGGVKNCNFGTNTSAGTTYGIFLNEGFIMEFNNLTFVATAGVFRAFDSTIIQLSNILSFDCNVGIFGDIASSFGLNVGNINNCQIVGTKHAFTGVLSLSTLTNNYLAANGTTVSLETNNSNDNSFVGNTIVGAGTNTIPLLIDNGNLNKFSSNTVTSIHQDGVRLQNGANDNSFSNNRFTGNGTNSLGTSYSIRVGTASNDVDDTLIIGNNLEPLGTIAQAVLDNGSNTRAGSSLNIYS